MVAEPATFRPFHALHERQTNGHRARDPCTSANRGRNDHSQITIYENEDQEDRDRFDAYTLPTRVEAFDADKEPGVERTVKLISARDFRKARSSDAFSSIS